MRFPVICSTLIATALLASGPAAAQECPAGWREPVVCRVEISVSTDGRHWDRLRDGGRVKIPAGGKVYLRGTGFDQSGWRFPEERLRFGLDREDRCDDLVQVGERDDGALSFTAGAERGRCRVRLWVPGNMNLDVDVRLEVTGAERAGYSRAQARFIADRLYHAILGREADRTGLAAAAAEIQRGRLDKQVAAMFASSEFRQNRRRLTAADLLTELYRGLLGRDPDSAGVRTYLRDVERGRTTRVVLKIIRSQEFDEMLLGRAEDGWGRRR